MLTTRFRIGATTTAAAAAAVLSPWLSKTLAH